MYSCTVRMYTFVCFIYIFCKAASNFGPYVLFCSLPLCVNWANKDACLLACCAAYIEEQSLLRITAVKYKKIKTKSNLKFAIKRITIGLQISLQLHVFWKQQWKQFVVVVRLADCSKLLGQRWRSQPRTYTAASARFVVDLRDRVHEKNWSSHSGRLGECYCICDASMWLKVRAYTK